MIPITSELNSPLSLSLTDYKVVPLVRRHRRTVYFAKYGKSVMRQVLHTEGESDNEGDICCWKLKMYPLLPCLHHSNVFTIDSVKSVAARL